MPLSLIINWISYVFTPVIYCKFTIFRLQFIIVNYFAALCDLVIWLFGLGDNEYTLVFLLKMQSNQEMYLDNVW